MMSRFVLTAEVSLSLHQGEQSSLCSFFILRHRQEIFTAKVAGKIRREREEEQTSAFALETVPSFAIDGDGFGYF